MYDVAYLMDLDKFLQTLAGADLTNSQYEFKGCIVLIHLSVNITVVRIVLGRGT